MSCRGFKYCGMGDDCPFDDQCKDKPEPLELDQWEDDGGPTWPVYEEAKGG